MPLSRPDITQDELPMVQEVLRSDNLALGPRIAEFERSVATYVGARYGVAVNSGTSALHSIVRSLGISSGDEVITSALSFVASSNCLLYEGATPIFVHVERQTGNIDPTLVEAAITPRTKAILSVDAFGHPARLSAIRSIATRRGLSVIEDACEALGSEYSGGRAGHPDFCDAAAFAFFRSSTQTGHVQAAAGLLAGTRIANTKTA